MAFFRERSIKTLLTDLKNWFALKAETVFSVNGHRPQNGDVTLDTVPFADNLTTDETQQSNGTFIVRTTGGAISLSDGEAYAMRFMGNRVHNGYVQEVLTPTVIPMPRPTPAAITAVLDEATFEAYVETAGTYEIHYSSGAWDTDPALYGVTVSNAPVNGDSISIQWDGENPAVMTVNAVQREAPDPIRITLDRTVFISYVNDSTTITLTFTTSWSEDPSLYGVTVINEPIAGDQISIYYVKEDRGTIVQATPTALVATGWNLYNNLTGYAFAPKYSDLYGYRIGGTYSGVKFSKTPDGAQSAITVTGGLFNIPEDGYIIVEGGDSTTYVYTTWSDWTEGYSGDFETYTEITLDFAQIMTNYFPYGLMQVGDVRDEINLNTGSAISRIERLAYNAENLALVAGRQYEVDTNYIYVVRTAEVVNSISLENELTVSEHGTEFFRGTQVGVYAEVLYGNNLKDKLRRNVLTIGAQTLSSSEQTQVRTNIGAGSAADVSSNTQAISNLNLNLGGAIAIVCDGDTHPYLPAHSYIYVTNNTHGLTDGLYQVGSSGRAVNSQITSSMCTAVSDGGLNALNSKFTTIEDKKITRIGTYFTERDAFKARRVGNAITIFSYVNITTQVSSSTEFADTGFSSAEGLFLFFDSTTKATIVRCSSGKLIPNDTLATGYYYAVGSAVTPI